MNKKSLQSPPPEITHEKECSGEEASGSLCEIVPFHGAAGKQSFGALGQQWFLSAQSSDAFVLFWYLIPR